MEKGKGTGPLRFKQWAERKKAEGWKPCTHECQIHGKWKHDVAPNFECHMKKYGQECPKCLEYPEWMSRDKDK